jgi:hypothetical protein
MSTYYRILKWSLLAGALYFFGVAAAHMLQVKVPVLFIYFNVPTNPYQDRIISFLAFGWAVFLFTASTDPQRQTALMQAVLTAGAGALLGLAVTNLTTDFAAIAPAVNPAVFWLETAGLVVYWLWLVAFYTLARARRAGQPG